MRTGNTGTSGKFSLWRYFSSPAWLLFVKQYHLSLLLCILAFAFVTRVYQLAEPQKYVFDEVYHAITVKLIAQNDPRAFEWWHPPIEPGAMVDWLHPPIAKYTQALGVLAFGPNSFGWRISSALFGVGVVWLVYVLAKEWFGTSVGLTAALLASFDGLLLTQSRIAMNDIHVTFFILLTVIAYNKYCRCCQFYRDSARVRGEVVVRNTARDRREVDVRKHARNRDTLNALTNDLAASRRWWFLATAISAGLALGSKWSGFFVIVAILLFETLRFGWKFSLRVLEQFSGPQKSGKVQKVAKKIDTSISQFVSSQFLFLLIVAAIYVTSYGQAFLQGKTLSHFTGLHNQIWRYQVGLRATHGYQSRPWQWFLNLRPVWYDVEYHKAGPASNIYAFGNPVLQWVGVVMVLVTLGWWAQQGWRGWKGRQGWRGGQARQARKGVSFFQTKQRDRSMWLSRLNRLSLSMQLALDANRPGTTNNWLGLAVLTICYFIVWLPWQLSPRIMFYYHYTPAVPFLVILIAYWLQKLGSARLTLGVIVACAVAFLIWYPRWIGLVPAPWEVILYAALPGWK